MLRKMMQTRTAVSGLIAFFSMLFILEIIMDSVMGSPAMLIAIISGLLWFVIIWKFTYKLLDRWLNEKLKDMDE